MAGSPSEDSLHALVTKADAASEKCRWARAADLYKRAALQASALYPHDSLVTVELQFHAATTLQGQARQPGVSVAEQRALHEEVWPLVREGMEVVSRRHASNTLGRNNCRPDEVQYLTCRVTTHTHDGIDAAERTVRLAIATSNASCYGVSVAMQLARLCLIRLHGGFLGLPMPLLAAPDRVLAEQSVFRALDYLASIRAVRIPIHGESDLVNVVQQLLSSSVMKPAFRAAFEARWASPDVVAVLRMHGALEICTARDDFHTEKDAAQRADVVEHGLLVCALPGCDKLEVTVRKFKVCSACRAVAYCSGEHGGLHWARGHMQRLQSSGRQAGARGLSSIPLAKVESVIHGWRAGKLLHGRHILTSFTPLVVLRCALFECLSAFECILLFRGRCMTALCSLLSP